MGLQLVPVGSWVVGFFFVPILMGIDRWSVEFTLLFRPGEWSLRTIAPGTVSPFCSPFLLFVYTYPFRQGSIAAYTSYSTRRTGLKRGALPLRWLWGVESFGL